MNFKFTRSGSTTKMWNLAKIQSKAKDLLK